MRTPAQLDEAEAALLHERAALHRRLAELDEAIERLRIERRGLQPREHSRSVNRDMTGVHKVAISRGRSGDPLAVAARKAGMTVTGLAKRVGVSKALLSMARIGDRSIKRDVCARIEALVGFAATSKNWPKITD